MLPQLTYCNKSRCNYDLKLYILIQYAITSGGSSSSISPQIVIGEHMYLPHSVTILGHLLDFGPLATINLPKSPTFLGNFCKGVKIYYFSSEIKFGQLLAIFSGHTAPTPSLVAPANKILTQDLLSKDFLLSFNNRSDFSSDFLSLSHFKCKKYFYFVQMRVQWPIL